MLDNKFLRALFLILNPFMPGIANIFAKKVKIGSALIFLSFILFFLIPYMPFNLTRALYVGLIIISYLFLLKKSAEEGKAPVRKYTLMLLLSFLLLSLFSLNFSFRILGDDLSDYNNEIVYVLGTKPFKKDSLDKMLDMSDDELFNLFNRDIHPFFRRLKTGIAKINDNKEHLLMISAGKNQKKIALRILKKANKNGVFFSCKSTKEEILALFAYIGASKFVENGLILVSDDYHAFRALFYSRAFGFKNVRFLATTYDYSISSLIKIYLSEQALFLLTYLSLPFSIIGVPL